MTGDGGCGCCCRLSRSLELLSGTDEVVVVLARSTAVVSLGLMAVVPVFEEGAEDDDEILLLLLLIVGIVDVGDDGRFSCC